MKIDEVCSFAMDFSNETYTGSGFIYNQAIATPSGQSPTEEPWWNTYEGNQGLYFISGIPSGSVTQNNDWMISPEFTIDGVSSPILSFKAKTLKDDWGLERFKIAIGSSTDYNDFVVISDGEYITGIDFRTLYITPENVNDSLRFVWNATTDIDGDDVSYRMIGYQGLEFLTMDESDYITDNYKTWALKDLAAQTDTVTVLEGFWNVIASDGSLSRSASLLNGQMRIDSRQLIPDILAIRQSYPNPFTNFTTIEYDVPSEQNVVIRIFNIRGQTVRTLVNEDKNAGYYTVVWDGTNDNGDEVSSGVYFCQMYTPKNPNGGQFVKANKMVKIR